MCRHVRAVLSRHDCAAVCTYSAGRSRQTARTVAWQSVGHDMRICKARQVRRDLYLEVVCESRRIIPTALRPLRSISRAGTEKSRVRIVPETKAGKCAHPDCNCHVGAEYCSDYCKHVVIECQSIASSGHAERTAEEAVAVGVSRMVSGVGSA
jgi:hypothetical protein